MLCWIQRLLIKNAKYIQKSSPKAANTHKVFHLCLVVVTSFLNFNGAHETFAVFKVWIDNLKIITQQSEKLLHHDKS